MQRQPHHFQHPLDRQSLVNLKSIKWFERLSKHLVADELERDFHLLNIVDNVLIQRCDFPDLHEHLDRACSVLGLESAPQLFLDTNPAPHTVCIGEQKPMIVLSSGLLELLDNDELAAAIAHEVGHVVCGHAYFKLLAENFGGVTQLANLVPGFAAATFTAKLPLYDWYRKADLTADRAALLVVGQSEPLLRMIGKIAGGSGRLANHISLNSLLQQANLARQTMETMQAGNFKEKAAYFFSNIVMQGMLRTQPWPAIRVLEIQEWSQSKEFQDLLSGKAPPESTQTPETEELEEKDHGFFKAWTDAAVNTVKPFKFWEANELEEDRDEAGDA